MSSIKPGYYCSTPRSRLIEEASMWAFLAMYDALQRGPVCFCPINLPTPKEPIMSQTQLFKGPNRTVTKADGATTFTLHKTPIVVAHEDGTVTLNSGGWRTSTTARAMNQASNEHKLGFTVFQRNRKWFVRTTVRRTPVEIIFEDGMTF